MQHWPLLWGSVAKPPQKWLNRYPIHSGPPVIWIGAQECTGCTESLLRATHPTVENLVLETISLEYHEVLSAAFGHQVEENKHNALEKYKGQYVLVVDGSIPLKDNGIYCMVAGEPIVDHIRKAADGAAAIIAIGSCSAWGGVAAAGVNPTGAVSLQEVYRAKRLSIFQVVRQTA
ncbi:hydrogenase-2 small chain protein [Salmonella enterica subsp. enterica]|uniref:hydrogenase (acceptor) n=1 Tax=Salmonella enterica I TaxID=59201 RepID=A0A379VJR3_SALET|nr:hydrogenase-2 small chain protein [Salmonella enterica subsp. enterica]